MLVYREESGSRGKRDKYIVEVLNAVIEMTNIVMFADVSEPQSYAFFKIRDH